MFVLLPLILEVVEVLLEVDSQHMGPNYCIRCTPALEVVIAVMNEGIVNVFIAVIIIIVVVVVVVFVVNVAVIVVNSACIVLHVHTKRLRPTS